MTVAAIHNQLHDFLVSLDGAATVNDAWQTTLGYMRDLGASHVGIVLYAEGARALRQWSAPGWIEEMYQEKVYPHSDPKLEHCRKNLTPYFYQKEFWDREPNLPEPRRCLDEELVRIGNRAAVAFPNHSGSRRRWGYFAFTTDMGRAEFERFYADRGAAIQLAGIGAFNRVKVLTNEEEVKRIGITQRERECLLWLGRGFQYDQIADRLGLRKVTVEYHIAKAKRKLNARTREQALVTALQLNLLDI
ncbi:MAG: LuxR family transcriptional regulator [Hyphomicrobiaceae bacterium]|nr:LuxR family transcriptional regulator [Hyphomicrobiaceae bacterium]